MHVGNIKFSIHITTLYRKGVNNLDANSLALQSFQAQSKDRSYSEPNFLFEDFGKVLALTTDFSSLKFCNKTDFFLCSPFSKGFGMFWLIACLISSKIKNHHRGCTSPAETWCKDMH